VLLVLLADGDTISLGYADQATGDPQNLGAFVTVAAPAQSGAHGWRGGRADATVELRGAEGSTILATSASLNRDLGEDPARPLTLRILPDSSGNQLAVVIDPVGSAATDDAVVVLDRRGRVLGALNQAFGPARGSVPSWSPDGSALAYYSESRRGAAIAVWAIGGRVHLRLAPNPDAGFDGCLWSPDGSVILCPTSSGPPQWVFGRAGGGRVAATRAPVLVRAFAQRLRPVAWLAGPGPS
jgi:hypothetical protein